MTDLVVHSCCAPCSGAVLETLAREGEKPVVFFSNSNIHTKEEYDRRLSELKRYSAVFGFEVVEDEYDHQAWLEAVRGLEEEPERGKRCLECFRFRLGRAARWAEGNGASRLTTTLASSRWKSKQQVDEAGMDACGQTGVEWWPRDWRKGGLQQRRSEIIREQGFYNQDYCGCEFSLRHTAKDNTMK